MVDKKIEFNMRDDGDYLELVPPTGADFRVMRVSVPKGLDPLDVDDNTSMHDALQSAINYSCGNSQRNECKGLGRITLRGLSFLDNVDPVDAWVMCGSETCPLDEPPFGDSEPIVPAPTPPSLQAEASI